MNDQKKGFKTGTREDDLAMTDEMIAWYEVSMKNLEKKGMQTDPLYLSMKESKQHLQIGRLELEDIYKRREQYHKGNVPAPDSVKGIIQDEPGGGYGF